MTFVWGGKCQSWASEPGGLAPVSLSFSLLLLHPSEEMSACERSVLRGSHGSTTELAHCKPWPFALLSTFVEQQTGNKARFSLIKRAQCVKECREPAGVHVPRLRYDYRRPGRVECCEIFPVAGRSRGKRGEEGEGRE